jgi:hypothetical protein
MAVLFGKALAASLRTACDKGQRRLWIASPYIGGWLSVRSVLGRRWWDDTNIDVRLLTDESTGPNGDTLRRIEQRGKIRHLPGLHAKLYIIGDSVLLTSANLTGTAFAKRYEAGILLSGHDAESAITLYEKWWTGAKPFNSEKLNERLRDKRPDAGEDPGNSLPFLNLLPSDPGDFGGNKQTDLFVDYPRFLDDYRTLSREYEAIQRIWPEVPLNFEVDGLLDYLYRWDGNPSREYGTRPPRELSAALLRRELKRYGKAFHNWTIDQAEDSRRLYKHSRLVRKLLGRRHIIGITKFEIRRITGGLQCLSDRRVRKRFLDNNTTPAIRRAWRDLLYGTAPLTERMSTCAGRLFGFKRSCVQELLGFFDPVEYPLRNATVNAGLRFFGFDVSAH